MNRKGDPSPRDSEPLVTISVVSHGNTQEIKQLISSMLEHENVGRIQLVVTDNLADDLPDLDGSGWGDFLVLRNRRPQGLARNHNIAFRHARGRYFCVLNPDVIFIQKIFQPLIRHLEIDEERIVAPLVVDSHGVPQDSFRNMPRPIELVQRRLQTSLPGPELPAGSGSIAPEWIAGVFLLMKSEVFGRLGGLDEKYRLYFEDVDFCTRARLTGLSLLVDRDLSIRHDASRSSRKDVRYLLWHLQSAFRFFTSPVYMRAKQRRDSNTP
jgi:N-acetylglucosaminyl-diphospho-decaprenol L-rhamnosyltransferase